METANDKYEAYSIPTSCGGQHKSYLVSCGGVTWTLVIEIITELTNLDLRSPWWWWLW